MSRRQIFAVWNRLLNAIALSRLRKRSSRPATEGETSVASFERADRRAQERHGASGARPLIAVGDIHGRADLLTLMFDRIDALDLEESPVEIYLGDYVDRGPDSAHVIELLIARGRAGRDLVCLLGNHETMFLRALEDDGAFKAWLRHGGLATALSYGVSPATNPARFREALVAAVPPAHKAFLRALRPSWRAGDYVFVHAGIRPGVALERQSETDLTTIREPFLSAQHDFGFTVVHGHTPEPRPAFRDHRIGLDTGAFNTSRLSALVLSQTGLALLTVTPEAKDVGQGDVPAPR